MATTQEIIISALAQDIEYSSKMIQFLKSSYFEYSDKVVFDIVENYIKKYNALPTKEACEIELEKIADLDQKTFNESVKVIDNCFSYDIEGQDKIWLNDITEKFIKDLELHHALLEAMDIAGKLAEGKSEGLSETIIPKLFEDAISIDFNKNIGIDYIEDAEDRFLRYGIEADKVPFAIEKFNKVTNGGFSKGFLNLFMAGTSGGKTLSMCSLAADDLRLGKNVLYITLELEEDDIAKRIDANLMGIKINDVPFIGKSSYSKNISDIKKKTLGNLYIYQDFSGKFNTFYMKKVLDDYKRKKNFVPDIVYIDYLGYMKSSIYKEGKLATHEYMKSVSVELRLLSKQYDFACVSAVQLNRSSYDDSDAGITGIADSWGITNTADWIAIILQNEELEQLGQFEIKQVKSKYSDLLEDKRFYIGVDKPKMKIYELEHSTPIATEERTRSSFNDDEILDRLERIKNLDFS